MFQSYWRPHTSKPGGGLGLGLYICTQIVKAHGGEMEVASSTTSGTVFGACLPGGLMKLLTNEIPAIIGKQGPVDVIDVAYRTLR